MSGITVFNDVILPSSIIRAGVSGKVMRQNERANNGGGFSAVSSQWTYPLRQYELGIIPSEISVWVALESLWEITEAGTYGFLMLDPKDQTALSGEGLLQPLLAGVAVGSIGLGYGVPTYQLFKRYTALGSTRTKDRPIKRPKSPSSLLRAGAAVTPGIGAGNVSVNYDTGVVAFVADASQAMTSITTGATTVLNFLDGSGIVAAMAVGERTYLGNVTGSAAATLNDKSHVITAKGATSITISTSTSGLAAAAGTAYRYPQASQALTWSGSFYVPVHFMDDAIDWDLVRSGDFEDRLIAGPSCAVIEVRE